jgi:hypothetical protein
VGRQMEDPFGPDAADEGGDRARVAQIGRVPAQVPRDLAQPPVALPNDCQDVDLLAVLQHAAGKIGADESRSAGDQHPSHAAGLRLPPGARRVATNT